MNMKTKNYFLIAAIIVLSSMYLANGCNEDPSSLYDPKASTGATPLISTFSPSDSGLAGVTDFTISGSNFTTDISKITVFFDAHTGKILQATSTQLIVRAPLLVKDTVNVKISVQGAMSFSNEKKVKLKSAVVLFDSIKSQEEPWGVAIDAQGNLYVSLNANGVKQFTPSGVRTNFTPNASPLGSKLDVMKFSPLDGKMYAVWGLNAIAILPGNNATGQLWVPMPNQNKPKSFDFDGDGNIWAAGTNGTDTNNAIVRVTPTKNIATFPLGGGAIRSMKVLNGYLYLAGTMKDSTEKVVRYKIVNKDTLGSQEVIFNLSSVANSTGKLIYAMVFTAQGDMLLGTNLTNPILKVSNGVASVFYPDVFAPSFQVLTWGKNTFLWGVKVTSTGNKLYKIDTQLTGLP